MATTLVIHGGSGTIREGDRVAYREGLQGALHIGYAALEHGESAVVAVLAALRNMEDNPAAFNAGTGGSPNRDGVVECDAAIMASDRSCGAVAGVTKAKNPVEVANRVRLETPHVMFVGAGADALLENPIDNAQLLTDRTRDALRRWRERGGEPVGSATVGAVALDGAGRLAAATSTGGVLGKWPGRVGDSPLIGAGTYADAHIAVSCTGKGEAFVRGVSAKTLASLLENGQELKAAVGAVLSDVLSLDGSGGLICLTSEGEFCVGFNAPHMAYAWKCEGDEKVRVGLEPGLYGV